MNETCAPSLSNLDFQISLLRLSDGLDQCGKGLPPATREQNIQAIEALSQLLVSR